MSSPYVDWWRVDLDDTGTGINIKRDYRSAIDPREPSIYQALIPISLFTIDCWEDWGEGDYDWSGYRRDAIYPPIKVRIGARKEPRLFIVDGNHRLRRWQQYGFHLAPCWVLDYTKEVKNA